MEMKQTSHQLRKVLRSANGGDYVSDVMEELMRYRGFGSDVTIPSNPHHSGLLSH